MNRTNFTLLIIVTTFIMGASIAVVKVGLEYASPLLLATFRYLFAGIILTAFVLKRNHPKKISEWLKLFIIGSFQSAGVSIGIFVSLRTISASETAILTYTSPLFVVIFGTLFFQMRYRILQWIGVIVGIAGVAITLNSPLGLNIGFVYGLFAGVCWGVATLIVKKWGVLFDTWVLSAYQMLFGGLLLLLCSFTLEKPFFIISTTSLLSVLWLVFIASIVQFALWYYLLQNGEPGKTSSFLFLAPLFGVLSGWLFLNEPLSPSIITGGLLIILAIFLVNKNYRSSIK